jgi:hypothetical protein
VEVLFGTYLGTIWNRMPATKPSTKDKTTLIKFRVATPLAAYLRLLGDEMGWGVSHTDVAKFVLLREVARLEEAEIHRRMPRLPEVDADEPEEA